MSKVPDTHRDILEANGTAFIATTGPKGSPQITPTWYLWDSPQSSCSSHRLRLAGRQKHRNMQREPRIRRCVSPTPDSYRYIEIRGSAAMRPDEDHRLANSLAQKYMNLEELPREMAGEGRVIGGCGILEHVRYGGPAKAAEQ